MDDNTFYLQIYRGITRGWEIIRPGRYVWDTNFKPQAVFFDSCPATKALGALARNNVGHFRVAVSIDGELKELVQAKGQGAAPRPVSTGRRSRCCS